MTATGRLSAGGYPGHVPISIRMYPCGPGLVYCGYVSSKGYDQLHNGTSVNVEGPIRFRFCCRTDDQVAATGSLSYAATG